jgi:hypothetical protein
MGTLGSSTGKYFSAKYLGNHPCCDAALGVEDISVSAQRASRNVGLSHAIHFASVALQ